MGVHCQPDGFVAGCLLGRGCCQRLAFVPARDSNACSRQRQTTGDGFADAAVAAGHISSFSAQVEQAQQCRGEVDAGCDAQGGPDCGSGGCRRTFIDGTAAAAIDQQAAIEVDDSPVMNPASGAARTRTTRVVACPFSVIGAGMNQRADDARKTVTPPGAQWRRKRKRQ